MEYVLITIIYILGVWIRSVQNIGGVRKKNPLLGPKQVIKLFLSEDWDTLAMSAGGLILLLTLNFITWYEHIVLTGIAGAWWFKYALASVVSYGGQQFLLKAYGTTGKAAADLVDKVAGKSSVTITETLETPEEKQITTQTIKTENK